MNRIQRAALALLLVLAPITGHALVATGGTIWTAYKNRALVYDPSSHSWTTHFLQGRVNGLDAGPDGSVWAATKKGIAGFTGGSWTYCTPSNTREGDLPDDQVQCLGLSADGMFLAGTGCGGLAAWDGKTWTVTDTTNGLSSMQVTALLTDRAGRLWAGTASGLNCFDGTTWKTYTARNGLLGNSIRSLTEDTRGAVWVECYNYTGLTVEDIKGGVCRFADGKWKQFLFMAPVTNIAQDTKGRLWLVTHNRERKVSTIHYFKDRRWAVMDSSGLKINDLRADRAGRLWVATGKGLYRYEKGRWDLAPPTEGRSVSRVYVDIRDRVWCCFSDPQGSMVIGEYNGTDWQLCNQFPDKKITCFLDADGTLWFGTSSGLVYRNGPVWQAVEQVHPSVSVYIKDLLYDRARQCLWAGTERGLACFKNGAWQPFYNQGLKKKNTYSIACGPGGAVWANSYHWYRRTDGSWTPLNERFSYTRRGNPLEYVTFDARGTAWFYSPDFPELKGYAGTELASFSDISVLVEERFADITGDRDQTGIWVGCRDRVWTISPGTGALSACGADNRWSQYDFQPLSLVRDDAGALALCERYRVARYTGKKFEILPMPDHLRFRDLVSAPGGELWIEGEDELARYSGGQCTIFPFPPRGSTRAVSYQWYPVADTVLVNDILFSGPAEAWLATTAGLYRLQDGAVSRTEQKNALPDAGISRLASDDQGMLWAVHRFGASRLKKNTWSHFDIRTGLISNLLYDCETGSDGSLWFTAPYGVSRYREGTLKNITAFGNVSCPHIQSAAAAPGGRIWLATLKGALRSRGRSWSSLRKKDGLLSDSVYAVVPGADKTVWFATTGGVMSMRKKKKEHEFIFLRCGPGTAFQKDRSGNVWLLLKTRRGVKKLFRLRQDKWTEVLKNLNIRCIAFAPDNTLYVGSAGGFFVIRDL